MFGDVGLKHDEQRDGCLSIIKHSAIALRLLRCLFCSESNDRFVMIWKVYCADVVVSAVVDELVVLLLLMLEGMGMKPRVRRTS